MNSQTSAPSDPAALEADIVRQREQLARTVDALSDKLDVKARAGRKVAEIKDSATTDSGRPRPAFAAIAGSALAAAGALVWWRRRS